MKIKIKVSFDKEYTLNNSEMDCTKLNEDELIGFFDDINTAEKAVEKFIEESKGYSLSDTMAHPFDDVDVCRFYRKDIPEGFYSIEVYYSLALIN